MMIAKVQKWGNSQGLRLSKFDLAELRWITRYGEPSSLSERPWTSSLMSLT
jgi:hypothetical protein